MNSEKVLLKLLSSADKEQVKGKTRLQKLVFLLDKENEELNIPDFNFYSYDYGPFSKELLEEIERLERLGFVEITKSRSIGGSVRYDYKITPQGEERLSGLDTSEELNGEIRNIIDEFGDKPLLNLIDEVYEKYPDYAEDSNLN